MNELTSNGITPTAKWTAPEVKHNSLGSRIGEQREVVVRYTVGRENEAKVYEGTPGENGKKEDSYALLYATGKLIGDITGLNGKELGDELIKATMKAMVGGALNEIINKLEDAFK